MRSTSRELPYDRRGLDYAIIAARGADANGRAVITDCGVAERGKTSAFFDLGRPADALSRIERAHAARKRALPPDDRWLVEMRACRDEIAGVIDAAQGPRR